MRTTTATVARGLGRAIVDALCAEGDGHARIARETGHARLPPVLETQAVQRAPQPCAPRPVRTLSQRTQRALPAPGPHARAGANRGLSAAPPPGDIWRLEEGWSEGAPARGAAGGRSCPKQPFCFADSWTYVVQCVIRGARCRAQRAPPPFRQDEQVGGSPSGFEWKTAMGELRCTRKAGCVRYDTRVAVDISDKKICRVPFPLHHLLSRLCSLWSVGVFRFKSGLSSQRDRCLDLGFKWLCRIRPRGECLSLCYHPRWVSSTSQKVF
jgi:hypothetical protein